MQPRDDFQDRLRVILRSIAIVAQQRVLADRSATLARLASDASPPTVPLNRTPLQALHAFSEDG